MKKGRGGGGEEVSCRSQGGEDQSIEGRFRPSSEGGDGCVSGEDFVAEGASVSKR
jgi:hypothetical protein